MLFNIFWKFGHDSKFRMDLVPRFRFTRFFGSKLPRIYNLKEFTYLGTFVSLWKTSELNYNTKEADVYTVFLNHDDDDNDLEAPSPDLKNLTQEPHTGIELDPNIQYTNPSNS